MGYSRQEYWSELPFPSPQDLPDPETEPGSPALQADSLPSELQEKSHSFLLGTAQSPKLPGSLPWDVPNPFVSNLWFIWPQRLLSSWTGIPLFYSEEMEKHQCGIGFILKLGNKHCIEWEHSSVKPLPTGEAKRNTVEQSKETNRSLLCVMAALFSPGSGCVSPCLCVGSLPAQPWSYHLCYFVITVGKPLFKGDRYTSS